VGGVGVPEHIVSFASVRGELRRIATSAQDAWTRARAFLHGLGVAWVSTASVLLALVLFAIAPPAQDLFLDVRGSLQIGFLFWLGTYAAIVLAWVVPVYISARWILCNTRRQDVLPAHARAVEDWVARAVPRVLAVTCLLAIFIGQVMALRNAPTLADPTSEIVAQQLETKIMSECGPATGWQETMCWVKNGDSWVKLAAIRFSENLGAEITIYWLYVLTFGPLLFFAATLLWRAMYGGGAYWRTLFIAFAVSVFAVCGLVLGSILYADDRLGSVLFGWLPELVVATIVIGSIIAAWSLLLFFFNLIRWKWVRIPLKVVWWLVTLPLVALAVVPAAVLDYGFITSELAKPLGLGQVALLPIITLIVAYGVWKLCRPPATESLLATADGASEEPYGAPRGVVAVFAVALAISGLLLAIQPFLSPVTVTHYVYRGLVAPILLGVLVPAVTLMSYLSLRLRLPIVALAIAVLAVMITVRNARNDVRPVQRAALRPTLEDSVNRWSNVNGCDWRVDPNGCPSPIIIAAAGGASRAAFLTASVAGKLLDDRDNLRPFDKQLFAISAVSGGALGGVVTYAALADSQIRERATNGLGAPPCAKDAHDTEWFRSGPAWGGRPESKMTPGEQQGPSAGAHEEPVEPDKFWRQCLQRIVAGDFLSPVFVSLVSNDLLGLTLLGDRAAILEDAWERRYALQTKQKPDYKNQTSTLQESLVDLRQDVLARSETNWLPVLLLNGTSETTGRRIITSDIDTLLARTPRADTSPAGYTKVSRSKSRLFRDAYDLYELFELQAPIKHFSDGVFTPDRQKLLTVLDDTVQIWDTEKGKELGKIRNTVGEGTGDELLPLIRNTMGEAKATTLDYLRAVIGRAKEDRLIESAEPSRDGKLLLITDKGGIASVWALADRSLLWHSTAEDEGLGRLVPRAQVSSAHFSPDSAFVLTLDSQAVSLRDARTGKKLNGFPAAEESLIEGAVFTPVGVRVLTMQQKDGLRQIWDLNWELKQMKGPVDLKDPDSGDAIFSPDGEQVLTLSKNGTARLWNATTGAEVVTVNEVPTDYSTYGFSPDGSKFIIVAPRKLVISLTTRDAQPVFMDSTTKRGVKSATFSNDGKRLLLVDGITAELWGSLAWGSEPLRTFKGEEGWVNGAVFSDDDQLVLTWTDNGVAIVWDASTGEQKQIFRISRSSMALCGKCDIRLSTAATMSARFPIISPHGNIRNKANQIVDRVVDGGYYENFGATTALELATELDQHYHLKPSIILINNEPATSGMSCISEGNRLGYPHPSQTMAFPIVEAPIYTMLETRNARGSHAAVQLCSSPSVGEQRFAFVTVAPDESNPGKELSMSWWLSKYVQRYLDAQAEASANTTSFKAIRAWRAH